MPNPEGPVGGLFEPSADARVAARQYRNLYEALVAEKFTEGQALELIGRIMTATIRASTGATG